MENLLKGKRVQLKTIDPEKAPLFNQWFNDPHITENLQWGTLPMPMELSKNFGDQAQQPSKTDQHFSIHALDLPEGEESYIGHISLHHIDWRNRVAELGIVIGDQKHLSKGYGTDAIKTLLHFTFMEMNLNKVVLRHYQFNERGHRAYLKAGFKEEGRLRQQLYRHGRFWDVIYMGILKDEFMNNQ
ncbi:MAG: GNAT family N-acetyltransferase [Tepidibacillus sp.]|uniref:GNAT family N-acetyltransferase n=1 Tax=Tepidibacillus sp. HK-1 TaxID=1883407 RepID=UPI000853835B|nr:GNAT family protein [Tepidibacillus sp. HK-1]GBF10826.1 putative ribosomal N-acetyltransferase YdaF [Tepidibacillus sp. HK-1]